MKLSALVLGALVFALVAAAGVDAHGLDLEGVRLVDLTHTFDEETLYWPNAPYTFRLERLAFGETEGGYFYSANAFCSPEHGGTHLDAPIHFGEGGETAALIPLRKLVAPAVVIDISSQAEADRDHRLTREEVLDFEKRHGRIEPGTIVLLRTGWYSRWPDAKRYLGDDTPGETSNLHFPSFGAEAARLLIEERKIALLGADVASIDYGPSREFPVHRIAAAAGVPGLENLANLEELPPRGALVFALPMKIANGSGGPARVIALVPER
jgi:kynurenine formamidase